MRLDEVYPKYEYIKKYLLDNMGLPLKQTWSDTIDELFNTLWPDLEQKNSIAQTRMLYALLYVARNHLPLDYSVLVGEGLKKQYIKYFNVKNNDFMYDHMHNYAYTILYNEHILVNNVSHPDGKSDLIDASDKFKIEDYFEHKGTDAIITVQRGEDYSWEMSYSAMANHFNIAIGPIEMYSPYILKTIAERDQYLQWLSNNNANELIQNVLSVLILNHQNMNDISPWLLEHFTSTLERNLPESFEVRRKITIAAALGLSITHTEDILRNNISNIDTNVRMPTIEFN